MNARCVAVGLASRRNRLPQAESPAPLPLPLPFTPVHSKAEMQYGNAEAGLFAPAIAQRLDCFLLGTEH